MEKHRDGYVAYPLGLKGAVVGQDESYESALDDEKSAAAFHFESFGKEAFDDQNVMEAFVTDASLTRGWNSRSTDQESSRKKVSLSSKRLGL